MHAGRDEKPSSPAPSHDRRDHRQARGARDTRVTVPREKRSRKDAEAAPILSQVLMRPPMARPILIHPDRPHNHNSLQNDLHSATHALRSTPNDPRVTSHHPPLSLLWASHIGSRFAIFIPALHDVRPSGLAADRVRTSLA